MQYLTRVRATNFKCFQDLDVTMPKSGFTLLNGVNNHTPSLGANGAGKTTLFDAICWGLYERTGKGLFAGKLLQRGQQHKGYTVTLDFEDAAGNKTEIKRTWGPNTISVNGRPASNSEIEALVNMSFDQFKLASYFHQGCEHFVDLPPGQKLEFLSEAFELDKWSERGDKAKELMRKAQAESASAAQALGILEEGLRGAEKRKVDLIQRQETWKVQQSKDLDALNYQHQSAIHSSQQWIESEVTKQKEQEAKLQELTNQLAEAKPDDTASVQLVEVEKQIEALGINNLRSLIASKQMVSDANQKNALTLNATIQTIMNLELPVCEACKQPLSGDAFQSRCEQLIAELEAVVAQQPALDNDLNAVKLQLETNLEALKGLTERRDSLLTAAGQYDGQLKAYNAIKAQAQALEYEMTLPKVGNPYTKQIEDLASRMANRPEDPYAQQLVDNELDITRAQAAVEERKVEVTAANAKQARYDYWTRAFPELRLEILDEIIQELEIHFNQALHRMGLTEWTIQVATDRELKSGKSKRELALTFLEGETEIDVDTISGGERQRVRLALAVGISDMIRSRTGTAWNAMLLDEPSLGLSQEGIEGMLGFFKEVSNQCQVVMADHRMTGFGVFDRIVTVCKGVDGLSTVEETQCLPRAEPVPV